MKITGTVDPVSHFGLAQTWSPSCDLYLHGFAGVQGDLAKRVMKELHRLLGSQAHMHGDWFTVDLPAIPALLSQALAASGLRGVDHGAMLKEVDRQYHPRISHQVTRAGKLFD